MRFNTAILLAIAMSSAACDGDESLGTIAASESGTIIFTGTLSGNAFVTVTPLNATGPVPLYIKNMKVEVLKKDGLADTVIGTGVTGEGGRFDVAYSTDSSDSIELYLRFVAESGDGMIRVRKKGVLDKWTRTQDVLKDTPILVLASSPDVSPPDQGDIELDKTKLKPQLLHWANRAREFVTAELGADSPLPTDTGDPLDILTPPLFKGGQTFFVPATPANDIASLASAGLIPLSPPLGMTMLAYVESQFSDQDALYISESLDDDDGTTMHEFGHYVMWYAQGKKWLNPLEASFAVHYTSVNSANSKIAWTEGFADGFARIVDAWSYMDDQEDDSDLPTAPETPGALGVPNCGAGAGATCNSQATSHGFFSERYIDHVVYDLWDGPNALVSGPNGTGRTVLSFDDSGFDNVELSFADLLKPILDTETTNQASLVANIVDYHGRLYTQQQDRAIKNLFVGSPTAVVGRIKNLQTSAGTNPALQDIPNTDVISFVRDVEIELYKVGNNPFSIVRSTGTQIEPFVVDIPTLRRTTDDYNVGLTGTGAVTLSDDLVVDGSAAVGNATLSFNSRTRPVGFRVAGNTYGVPAGVVLTAGPHLDVTIADGAHITAKDRGTITLGETGNGQSATVTVADGGTLELGGGLGGDFPQIDPITGQMVSKGKVFIREGSKLVVERGGTLIINHGAEIAIDGVGAELIIRGNLIVRSNATFWWTASGGGLVTFDLENLGGAPNVTLEPNAQILAEEVEFVVEDDTYVRLPEGFATRFTMRNAGRAHLGKNAYIDGSHGTVSLEESVVDAHGGALHLGIILNGGPHLIDDMSFSGGQFCLRETQGGVPLLVTRSDFTGCKTAVDVTGASVGLTDVTITNGTTGLLTRGSAQVGIGNSQIFGVAIGWRMIDRGNGNQGVGNSEISGFTNAILVEGANPPGAPPVVIDDSTITGGASGVRSIGNPIRITRSTIQNSGTGVLMESGAVLDLSSSASTEFTGNDTSIRLVSAGVPRLDGSNLFYPKSMFVNGVALSGTINDQNPCTSPHTIKVTSDVWEVWNIGAGSYIAQSMTTSPYSLTSAQGCAYTLVN